MKKTIAIIITVSVTLLVAGLLHGGHVHMDYARIITLDEVYTTQFPEQMPDVVIDPMHGFPIY